MAAKWYKVSEISWSKPDDESDTMLAYVKVKNHRLCLVKQKDELYAFNNKCPHAGGSLSEGWVENGRLICPIHRHSFDLNTGKGTELQGDCIRTFQINETAEGVFIELPHNPLNPLNWLR